MRKFFRIWVAFLMVLGLMITSASGEDTREEAVDLELPEAAGGELALLSPSEDPAIGPHGEGYLFAEGKKSPYGYADPSITVSLGTGVFHKTNYMYARVRIANPYQIRVLTAEKSLSKKTTVMGTLLAKRIKAVAAINGVLEADKTSDSDWATVVGPVMIQGEWRRPDAKTSGKKLNDWLAASALDTLVIDSNGDLQILTGETWGDIMQQVEELESEAVNVFTFGPGLVVDGEPVYGYDSRQMSTNRPAQRVALCQTGPLEYLLITSEGPDDPPVDKQGLKLDEFVELIATEFPEVKTAYNLDGGSSSTLVFRMGSEFWGKVNCPNSKRKRGLRDIIYFADAWIPAE